MLKKIVRTGLPLAVVLGLVVPTVRTQEPQKTEKGKKKTSKSKQKRKGEEPKKDKG